MRARTWSTEFKQFLLRGNVIDLAVGIFNGDFLNALVAFLTVAFALFFFVVKPVNVLTSRMRLRQSPDPSTRKCPECLSEIPIAARRCAFCAIEVPAGGEAGTGTAA